MKILVLLPRFPYPLDKGDKLRAYHQIVELAKRHDIYLFALSHEHVEKEQVEALQPYCKAIHVERLPRLNPNVLCAFLQGQSLQVGYWTTRHAKKAFDEYLHHVQPDVIYRQMVRTMKYSGGGVLDFQDALSLNTRRRKERAHGLWRLILGYEEKALQRAEQQALHLFDATTIISPIDRDAITQTIKQSGNQAIAIVPNGVDTDYFKVTEFQSDKVTESPSHSATQPLSHYTIVFTGNMSYAPNVDAERYLVKEIMPLVWKQCPYGKNVLIAGADPKPAVRALAGPRVTVSGRMDDIRSAYASARMFVAPMRIGSGMQNKLLEAMSMGLPCVTTSIAATPLGATPWEHLLVGDTAEEIADLIVKLTIEETHHAIADGGHRFVQQHYSWSAAVAPLEAILKQSSIQT